MFPGEDYISQCNRTSMANQFDTRLSSTPAHSIRGQLKLGHKHDFVPEESNWCCDSEEMCNRKLSPEKALQPIGMKGPGSNSERKVKVENLLNPIHLWGFET